MLYFIHNPSRRAIKIGYTAVDSLSRFRALQTASPDVLVLLGVLYPGEREDERALHARFSHLSLNGEWFRDDDALLEYIQAEARPSSIKGRKRQPIENSIEPRTF
jgi:hypothetical protein